jgi:acetyl esterase/lipase
MGFFLGLVYTGFTFNLASMKINGKFAKLHKTAIAAGILITLLCFLPIMSTPYSIAEADRNFSDSFGTDWRDRIDSDAQKFFLQREFTIPGYFLGVPEQSSIIKQHISFLNITTGENEGVRLYFDAYLPPNNGVGLPGQNSTLIRIHGGAWVLGDKGIGNMLQMNKYFASQGYVVFDIQYGLYKSSNSPMVITPEYVRGNFTIEEMVDHVGEFTKYLIGNYEEYGANLNSVFVSGGSAGGQLTLAAALGIFSENYTGIFGSGLTIKGIIPYYPAIRLSNSSFIPGGSKAEFLNPRLLIEEENAPPCLIFQGTHDSLISSAQTFTTAYRENGNDICLILLPFAGHANDLYFSGYYNQVFLFYMERFMYLFR